MKAYNERKTYIKMEEIKNFLSKYWGGVIGGVIALILACTGIVLIFIGIWAGNYFQHNKSKVKEKIKYFVDKM